MKTDKLSVLFRNKTFLVIFSLVAAVIAWAAVVLTISPEATRTIEGVPVTITGSNSAFQALGLDIIDKSEILVNVTVRGTRSVVGSLDASSITVTPNLSSVTSAGSYDVSLSASKNNQLQDYVIEQVNPGRITLRFDVAVSKKMAITSEIVGLTASGDLIVEKTAMSPFEVTLTGPELEVESVASVVARVEVNATLSETLKRTVNLVARDADGNDITSSALRIDPETTDITVPILKRGTLPLAIEFSNVPEGFDTSSLKYTMSHTEISIAAAASVIDNLKPKTIGYVDLTSFEIGETYTFDIQLSSGTVNLDNITQVTVAFQGADISSKRVNVTDIRVENEPSNYNVEVKTAQINSVTVIGLSEDVENVLAGSVVAVVDMNTLGGIESGEFNVPVSFVVTSNNTTWVAGSYTVVVEVTPA